MNGTDSSIKAGVEMSDWMGLVLPGILVLAIGLFVVVALALTVHRKSWRWGITTGISAIALAASFASLGVVFAKVFQKQAEKSSKPWVATSEDGQHRFTVPGHWKEDEELGEDAEIGLSNRVREQYLLLVDVETANDAEFKDWAEAVRDETAERLQNAMVGELEQRTIGDRPALFSRVSGRAEGIDLAYHITYVQLPGRFVCVHCWTLPKRERVAFPIFDKVVASYTYTPTAVSPATLQVADDSSAPVPERVKGMVADLFGVPMERVRPEVAISSLGADDLDRVELIMALEDEFGGEISDELAEKLETVADVIRWAEAQQKRAAALSESSATP